MNKSCIAPLSGFGRWILTCGNTLICDDEFTIDFEVKPLAEVSYCFTNFNYFSFLAAAMMSLPGDYFLFLPSVKRETAKFVFVTYVDTTLVQL